MVAHRPNPSDGFTLTEMIIVLVIVGIVATMAGAFITRPMEGYIALSRRAELVDAADSALRRVARDIRQSLPNSIRVDYGGDGTCDNGDAAIEMLNTVDAAVYRAYPPPGDPDKRLAFDSADDAFNVYDHFRNITTLSSTDHFLAINSVNNTEVYQTNSAVRTPDGTTIQVAADGSDEDRVTLSPAFQFDAFGGDEPPELDDSIQGRRVYLVDGPVQYRCSGGALQRYQGNGYGITPSQGVPGITPSKVADHVDCSATRFCYDPGSAQRAGLATLEIRIADEGETVTLLHQVHVVNVP